MVYMGGGRRDQSRIPLLTITGVSGQGKTEALYSIHRDDVVKVGSASLPYTEHIKALFSQHSQWKPVARVLRVFATFNQWTPYNPQWDTVGEGSLSLRLLWAFHGEVLGVAIRPCTLNLQDTLIHIQKTEAKKLGLLPEQVTVVVLVDELRKVPPCANEIDDTRRQLLNAITGAQYNFVISCRPIFFVVSCLELNAVYNVVSTGSQRPLHAVPLFPCPSKNLGALCIMLRKKLQTERDWSKLRSHIFQCAGHYRTLERIADCVIKTQSLDAIQLSSAWENVPQFNALLEALRSAFAGIAIDETSQLQLEGDVDGATLFELADAGLVLYESFNARDNTIKPTVLPQALRCQTGVTISSTFLKSAYGLCTAIRVNCSPSRDETRKLWEQFVPLVELLKAALLLRRLKQNSGGAVRLCGGVYPANGVAVMGWDGSPRATYASATRSETYCTSTSHVKNLCGRGKEQQRPQSSDSYWAHC